MFCVKTNNGFIKVKKLKLFLDINIWVYFSPQNLKWSLAKQTLATQAQKALKRLQYKCGFLPVNVAIGLFDKQILPILIYGSEIWGYEFSPSIENVQTSYLKSS